MKPILKSVATVHGMSGEVSVNHSEKHTFSKLLSIHQKKMFWGIFIVFGPGSLIPIERMMNSDKYKDILANYLFFILSDIDSRAGKIFQQDLAPCHISKKMQTFFAQTGINLLDWPGNSPALNPIENFWAIIKKTFLNMIVLQKYC